MHMHATPTAKLLIVDDEAAQMKALCHTLSDEGYAATGFTSAKEALAALHDQEFDLLLTDLMMPEMDGLTLLRAALEIDRNLVGIMMTGHGAIDTAVEAMKVGAHDYIIKPFKLSAVLPVLARALGVRRLRTENLQLRETVSIYELSMAIAFANDFNTVLQNLADAAFQQSDGGEVSILLPAGGGNELHVAVARGKNSGRIQGQRVPISEPLLGWVARFREALSRPSRDEASEFQPAFEHPLRDLTSGVSLPMLAGGKLIGILNFTSSGRNRSVTPGQVKALNILAGAAASALEAATLLQQLSAAEKRYRRLAENAPDIVFHYELSPQRRYAYVSPVVASITGYTPEDHYADPDLGFKLVHPDDRPLWEAVVRGDFPTGSTTTLRWAHKDGAVIWIEQHNVLLHDDAGQLVAIEGIARDISERRRSEEALRQYSGALERSNRDLEQFAYVASHDLQEPLRAVAGCLQILQRRYQSQLDANADELIVLAVDGAHRLQALIEGLLAFSRVGTKGAQFAPVECGQAVGAALKNLTVAIQESGALVTQDALPTVQGDLTQLTLLFQNLISNAIKFRQQEQPPCIHVAAESNGKHWTLSVRDNGIGIDPQYYTRIFEIFQRLHTRQEYPGTGIGLAICNKIVERHGGRIWVESAPLKGSAFHFTVPKT